MARLDEEEDKVPPEEETKRSGTGYVLRVAAPGTVLSYPFPRNGVVSIGRGIGTDLRIPVPDMSRRHISIRWEDDRTMSVCDVGSSNGTTLRGKTMTPNEWHPLGLREPLFVSDAALVVHEGSASDAPRRLVGYEAFEATLKAHLGTYAKSHRPFGVCAVEVDHDAAWTDFVVALLSKNDVVGYLSETSVRLLLVDREPAELEVLLEFLQKGLANFNSTRKVTIKACPRDGDTLQALYSGARDRVREPVSRETRRPSTPVQQSTAMRKVYALVDEVARTPTSILILGETGVGKDVLARAIHQRSDRFAAALVGLNCAALPETLLESELFGYERGAFTGAVAPKQGLLESAEGGTVFLDEVGEMPLSTQAKLLRVLEERKVMRLGGLKPKAVNFRLLAATNRNLQAEIQAGRFRADLFYRINGLAISIPPLRERREEIIPLAHHFAERAAATLGRSVPMFATETLACFERYTWPGNIRELRSVVERAVLLARGGAILVDHLPDEVISQAQSLPPVIEPIEEPVTTSRLAVFDDDFEEETGVIFNPQDPAGSQVGPASSRMSLRSEIETLEHERITAALLEHGGNQTRAAQALGMTRRALIIRLERYGMPRPRKAKT